MFFRKDYAKPGPGVDRVTRRMVLNQPVTLLLEAGRPLRGLWRRWRDTGLWFSPCWSFPSVGFVCC